MPKASYYARFFVFKYYLEYQSAIILNHFEGLNLSLTALKISDLEQLNNEILPCYQRGFIA